MGAFINEHNGVMTDVEAELIAHLEDHRHRLQALADRGGLPVLEAQALHDSAREAFVRIQDRLNAYGRRIVRMRESGEL